MGHYRTLSLVAIASTAGLASYGLLLQPDEKRYSGLSESGEPARALRHLDKSLGGLEFGLSEFTGPRIKFRSNY